MQENEPPLRIFGEFRKYDFENTAILKSFGEEHPEAKLILVSMEERPRMLNGVEVWPVVQFLDRLWSRKII